MSDLDELIAERDDLRDALGSLTEAADHVLAHHGAALSIDRRARLAGAVDGGRAALEAADARHDAEDDPS